MHNANSTKSIGNARTKVLSGPWIAITTGGKEDTKFMPCYDSGPDRPTAAELRSIRLCSLLTYTHNMLGLPIPRYVTSTLNNSYGDSGILDRATQELCELMHKMTPEQVESIVYNARSTDSRKLADWWEEHQEWDKARLRREQARKEKQRLVWAAKAKLTKEELAALLAK